MLLSNSSVALRDLAYFTVGATTQGLLYGDGGTVRPPNTSKETGIQDNGRATCQPILAGTRLSSLLRESVEGHDGKGCVVGHS